MRTVGPVQPESGFVEIQIAIEKLESYKSSYIDQILTQLI
jgi:hypothetical protein